MKEVKLDDVIKEKLKDPEFKKHYEKELEINRRLKQMKKITDRQREIIKLFGTGLTRKEVAEELGLSPDTIATHLRNAYSILDVNNIVQAIRAIRRK